MSKKKIVFFTGAGVSKESGIDTFRDSGGLWDNFSIVQVATATAILENTEEALEFYNNRRRELKNKYPNQAHKLIANLEDNFDVTVITQNVDNLHERAGSTNIIHLHGELTKAKGMDNKSEPIDIGYDDINIGDRDINGIQLRPNVVLFGEDVPLINKSQNVCFDADILVVIGTSLNVYPAASIVELISDECVVYNINPDKQSLPGVTHIQESATVGMEQLYNKLIDENR